MGRYQISNMTIVIYKNHQKPVGICSDIIVVQHLRHDNQLLPRYVSETTMMKPSMINNIR